MSLDHLAPRSLWRHFAHLATIPHGSGDEGALRAVLIAMAQACVLEHQTDAAGNLLVRKPAVPGREARPGIVVQAHLDMVCEKHGHWPHDFARDPLRLQVGRDGWLRARGTTLGADNGIGVAAMMALMEDRTLPHGPLELLFTVAEETGMRGARGLEPGWLQGRFLINLDAECDDTLIVGCAGSRGTLLSLAVETAALPADRAAARICLGGLLGGHSGMDIHRGRANPIRLLARLVADLETRLAVRLGALEAGFSPNALAREARAVIGYPAGRRALLTEAVAHWEALLGREYAGIEPGLKIDVQDADREIRPRILTQASQRAVLDLLLVLPHGVLAMSAADSGLVETSNNLAAVATGEHRLTVSTKQRSLVDSRLEAVHAQVAAAARLAGAAVSVHGAYPPWIPRADAVLRGAAAETYRRLFGRGPRVGAMHAGLECGLIGQVYPHLEMVAIGPNLRDPHSPQERVEIASVGKFWRYLKALLAAL